MSDLITAISTSSPAAGSGLPTRRYAWTLAIAWTMVIGAILAWSIHGLGKVTLELATNQARASFDKEWSLRRWVSAHGGVYVAVSERAGPIPYLSHVPGRDLTTRDGRQLTLYDPATIIRQLGEEYPTLYGVVGRIVSDHPLRRENLPDDWERDALAAFASGMQEVSALTARNGETYLRLMRPIAADASCRHCHQETTHRAGAIAGGAGVLVPMTPFLAREHAQVRSALATHALIWLLGIAGIAIGARRLARHDLARRLATQRAEHASREQAIVNALLRIALGAERFERKLDLALEAILSTPWLPLQGRGVIFLVDAATAELLTMQAQRGLSPGVRAACARVPFGRCLCGRAAAGGQILFAGYLDRRHNIAHDPEDEAHSHYVVPIVSGARVLGVIALYLDAGHRRSADEMRYLGVIANTLAGLLERERAEAALRASRERYALASRGANDGLWDWDLAADEIYYSPRWKEMLGCTDADIGTRPAEWLERVHPDDLAPLRAALDAHWQGGTAHFEHEHRLRHRDGSYLWVLARGHALRDAAGAATRMAGSLTDITERKRAEIQALHDALHDALTGLPNRVLFTDRLQRLLARSGRSSERPFAVLFLDVDRFKNVNDSLGHAIGDRLLVEVGRRLGTCLRRQDTVARFGGDEFAVLLEDVADVSEVTLLAERIQAELARPFLADGHEVYTGASIGIALSSTGYQQPEDLLRDADTAMYRAKAGGRGGYAVFDASMHARAVALLNLESDLRRALERHELRVHYQPVVELAGGHVVGVEALVRWRHPGRGLLSPAEFIAVAEETGLIVGIGDFVLAEACAQLRRWRDDLGSRAPAWVSVNLSPRGLARPGLAERVQALLASHGLESGSLWLEITEDTLMADAEAAVRTLNALRDTGVRLCLDDFGTGHSSLGYLHRFPIQTLKIDRSFIGGAGSGVSNLTIATSVIALAHGLGVDVIAEGVETAEQLAQLRELHCEYGQGFLFARPLPAAGLAGLLGDDRRW